MQYANVMQCMILHELNVYALNSFHLSFFLLDLPLSHPRTLHGPAGSVFLSFALESASVSMLASRAVSWKQTHFWFNPLNRKHEAFRLHALDFTTLALSINSA